MNIFHVFELAYIVDTLQAGYPVPTFFVPPSEWVELEEYIPLQYEHGLTFAAVLSAPLAIVEGGRTINGEADDQETEDWMEYKGLLK